jgi:hypothetical protein
MRPVKRVMQLSIHALLFAASICAQTPDLSGRWQLAPETNTTTNSARSVPTMGTGWGNEISIAQDATTLTIEFTPYVRYDMQPPTRLVYRLDGKASANTLNVGRGPQEQTSTAAWDGSTLTLTTVRTFTAARGDQPMTVQTTQTLSLESPTTLVVETTHGAALGGQPSTNRSVYKKH